MTVKLSQTEINPFDIVDAIASGHVSERAHPDDPGLLIYNYTPSAQYEGVWTKATMACRGLILRMNGAISGADTTIEARPFPKFFNLGELESVPEGPFIVQEKMDGSLGIVYRAPDGLPAVATRGSFSSDQAIWATGCLRSSVDEMSDAEGHLGSDETLLLEIIYPENRIVVNYGDFSGLVGLTAIDNVTGLDVEMKWSGTSAPFYPGMTLETIKKEALALEENREGFVLLYQDGTRVKVKLEEYVRLHKIVTGVTERSVWQLLVDRIPVASLAEHVPDEFFQWMKKVEARLNQEFTAVETACFNVLKRVDRSQPRKDQAEFILKNDYSGIVFRMLDDKLYRDLIWAEVRPEAVGMSSAT